MLLRVLHPPRHHDSLGENAVKSGLFQFEPTAGVLPPGSVSNAELAAMAALTVKANPVNASGQPQDVAAASNDTVFRRTSDTLNWGGVTDGMLAANTIALTKLANAAAQYNIVGRKSLGAGAWEDCTRTELRVAGSDLSNTFTLPQIISISTGQVLQTVTTAGTGIMCVADGTTGTNTLERNQGNSGGAVLNFDKSRGSNAVKSAVNFNDAVGQTSYRGYDGADYRTAAQIIARVIEATPSSTAMAGRLEFYTSPIGSVTPGLVVAIESVGVKVGGTAAANLVIDANRLLNARVYTFGTLPAAGVAGRRAQISDGAAAPVFGAAAAGGGALQTPVYDTGAAWNNG